MTLLFLSINALQINVLTIIINLSIILGIIISCMTLDMHICFGFTPFLYFASISFTFNFNYLIINQTFLIIIK